MPRTRSLAWSELKIGIVAVIAIALAITIIIGVGGQGGLFSWDRYELKTKFRNVGGLKSGAVVRIAGVEVGKVTRVGFEAAEVLVTFEVKEEHQPRITDKAFAWIGSLSMLGEPIVEITPSAEGRVLQDGEFIQSGKSAGQIADVAAGAGVAIDEATAMLRDIRAGKGSVGKLFTDDQLYREIQGFVASAESVANHVASGRGTIGMLARDPKAYRELDAALTNLRETTRRINAGEGSIGKLLKDDALANSLNAVSGNVDRITARLDRGEGTAGKLLTDRELWDRFNSIAGRIDKLVGTLEQSQGTAGQLLHDKQLYENINGAATELKSLIADIRRDPKKYLNVRVSIF
jgi:phospholipid/cholesterol/gamma-HCH transport system substrate-binding protein